MEVALKKALLPRVLNCSPESHGISAEEILEYELCNVCILTWESQELNMLQCQFQSEKAMIAEIPFFSSSGLLFALAGSVSQWHFCKNKLLICLAALMFKCAEFCKPAIHLPM